MTNWRYDFTVHLEKSIKAWKESRTMTENERAAQRILRHIANMMEGCEQEFHDAIQVAIWYGGVYDIRYMDQEEGEGGNLKGNEWEVYWKVINKLEAFSGIKVIKEQAEENASPLMFQVKLEEEE